MASADIRSGNLDKGIKPSTLNPSNSAKIPKSCTLIIVPLNRRLERSRPTIGNNEHHMRDTEATIRHLLKSIGPLSFDIQAADISHSKSCSQQKQK